VPTIALHAFRVAGGRLQTQTSSSSPVASQDSVTPLVSKLTHSLPCGPSLYRRAHAMPCEAHTEVQLPPAGMSSNMTAQLHCPDTVLKQSSAHTISFALREMSAQVDNVGDTVGCEVGTPVGTVVGDVEGGFVGLGDGACVGGSVGAVEGVVVGTVVGVADGRFVGPNDGACVGGTVGAVVGVLVGAADGAVEGFDVGDFVGVIVVG